MLVPSKPVLILLGNFWAPFGVWSNFVRSSSNVEQVLPFWATFEQNISLFQAFSQLFFRAEPQLTERPEEASKI